MNGNLDSIDRIRGVAILMVLAYHALGIGFGSDHLPWHEWTRGTSRDAVFDALTPLTLGWMGVPMFFAVSGFCIHLSHANSKTGFLAFFVRRAFRVYPPYILAVLAFSFAISANRIAMDSANGYGQLLGHTALLHNLVNDWFYGISPAFWSIAVEAQLYLIYPLLLSLVSRKGWAQSLLILGFIEFSIRIVAGYFQFVLKSDLPRAITDNPFAYWFSWGFGAFAAEQYRNRDLRRIARISAWPFAIAGIAGEFIKPLNPFAFPAIAIATTLHICHILLGEPRPIGTSQYTAHVGPLLGSIGRWSYSIYLWHQPVMLFAGFRLSQLTGETTESRPLIRFVGATLALIVLIPACAMSFRWIETPFAKLGKRIANRIEPSTTYDR